MTSKVSKHELRTTANGNLFEGQKNQNALYSKSFTNYYVLLFFISKVEQLLNTLVLTVHIIQLKST